MRRESASPTDLPLVPTPAPSRDWNALRRLLPYLWQYKWRVLAALRMRDLRLPEQQRRLDPVLELPAFRRMAAKSRPA